MDNNQIPNGGKIVIRVFDKYWETICFSKIIKKFIPGISITIICNRDISKLKSAEGEVIYIQDDLDLYNKHIPNKKDRIFQGGALNLLHHAYIAGKGYRYVILAECDDWPLTNVFFDHIIEVLNNKNIDFISEKKPNDISYPSRLIYDGMKDLFFTNKKFIFENYKTNTEQTVSKIIKLTNSKPILMNRDHKFGYCNNFGTFHHDTIRYGKKKYLNFYDEKNNKIIFNSPKNKNMWMGD